MTEEGPQQLPLIRQEENKSQQSAKGAYFVLQWADINFKLKA